MARKGRAGRGVRAGRSGRDTTVRASFPREAEQLVLEAYREAFELTRDEIFRQLDLKQDAWDDRTLDQLRIQIGSKVLTKFTSKLDRAIHMINDSVNKSLVKIPKIYAHKYASAGLQTMAQFRARNLRLIESVPEFVVGKVGKVLRANPNLHVVDLRDKLDAATGVGKARAELWARDQTLKCHGQVVQDKHESIGITEYIWKISDDERVRGSPKNPATKPGCDNHWILRNRKFKYSQPPVVSPKTGRRAHPHGDFQCRCEAEGVLPDLTAA